LTAIALLFADFAPGVPGPSSLLSRSVDVLRDFDWVRRILVALPPGQHAPGGCGALRIDRNFPQALDDVVRESEGDTSVVLHDPCRTPVNVEVFAQALAELHEGRCDAVVAAAPATDTLKRVDGDHAIVETVDRSSMWEIRTPQIYRVGALQEALACASRSALSEAIVAGDHGFLPSLVRGPVRIVPLPRESMRVERPGDADLVERVLAFAT
jgi:2-C-methyl-D-erythritol 4-phosphate cytidylyltransferase